MMADMPENARRLHLLLRGVVQGVGFRFFVERQARELGLRGWVRNVGHDMVEILVEGPVEALERFATRCQQGPRGAVVESVDADWAAATGEFGRFEIRPTATSPLWGRSPRR